jgi:epoxide hydrolase-like predicted phosphatase
MAIHALTFDVGGVFLQLPDDKRQQCWELHFGLVEGALAQALRGTDFVAQATLGRIRSEVVPAKLGQILALTPEQRTQIQQRYFVDECLDPAIEALLHRLRPHYRLALLTNAWSDARTLLTERFPLSQFVDEMVISAEVGLAKPDPAIYHLTLDRLGVGPQEALFVDNKLRNTSAAEALGIPAITFHNSTQAIAAIEHQLEQHNRTTSSAPTSAWN